ncbi:MAG TPA: adenylosuccinate lyase, partial [Burkholderiales bacterium]|nr:adenylosuccinate lyase [Burkholderiales bacterium]
MMPLSALTALSPLDGRYRDKISRLSDYFSEFGLIRFRILVEVEWLKALCAAKALEDIPALSPATVRQLDAVVRDFSVIDGEAVKQIEARINHDVKAIEYWLKEKLSDNHEIAGVARF